jgi:hypothetical protein
LPPTRMAVLTLSKVDPLLVADTVAKMIHH